MTTITNILLAIALLAVASHALIITSAQVQKVMPYNEGNVQKYFANMCNAMKEGKINTCARVTAFLAQIGHAASVPSRDGNPIDPLTIRN